MITIKTVAITVVTMVMVIVITNTMTMVKIISGMTSVCNENKVVVTSVVNDQDAKMHKENQFSSFQSGGYALGKAHMRSAPSLRSFPNVAFETVPTFI